MTKIKRPIIEYDICGQLCPSALLVTLKELNDNRDNLIHRGAILAIKTDNRDSVSTIPDAANNMGYQVKVEKINNYYSIQIFK